MTPYVTLSIVNNSQANGTASGLADDAIYLFLTQETLNQAWRMDPATGVASPMPALGTLAPAFTLAGLKAAGGAIQLDASVPLPSARLYFSSSPDAVTAPNSKISGPTASTADFFYDFVEVSLTCTAANPPAHAAPDNLNLDCTQVDQLGIPFTLQVTPRDPSFGAGSGIVATLDRQTLVADYKAMAVGPLAPFADCVYPGGSDASTPYRLLNPGDVINGQLRAASLQGTLAVSGAPGAWQASFSITGPGTPAPTNGGLVVGMPVSGPLMPAGATVGSLPGAPSGNTVVVTSASSAASNPFTASTSPVELFFLTPPTTALATWFDAAIDNFFAWCKKNPGLLQIEQNNNGNHLYTGNLVQVGGIIDISGNSNTYTVLQFTGGNGEAYNLYYPFFSTNSAAGKTTPFGADVPPPPAWWTPLKGLMYYAPPSMMVFGASGVFADNTQQPLTAPNTSAVLGAIENVIVTALGRGYATTWKFLQGGITPGNPATTATVSLSGGATTAGLVDGMDMASFQIANIPMTASIPAGAPVGSFSVSSPQAILPTTPDLLTFSQFYPAGGTWSAFANFLHAGHAGALGARGRQAGRRGRRQVAGTARLAGQRGLVLVRLEFALGGVVDKQPLGQRGLVVEHVDQEAQGAQVVAETVEDAGRAGLLFVGVGLEHALDQLAHVRHRQRGLVQLQHGQHALHLRQLPRHHGQQLGVLGCAEKQVQRFFQRGEGRVQLAHHAAHGLLVVDALVELLHPRFERLRLAALARAFEPLGEPRRARPQLGVVGIEIVEHGFQVEHGGGEFQRQFGAGRLAGADRAFNHAPHGARQRSLGGCSLTSESVTRLNWSVSALNLPRSPGGRRRTRFPWPRLMRLRAWAIRAGAKRPNCSDS
jgi:hypothetical protein